MTHSWRKALRGLLAVAIACVAAQPCRGDAAGSASVRQSLDDAWWTGPMLANSAGTLARGHVLIEPYFYDVRTAHADGVGSSAYLLYGLVDRLTVGVIPVIGFHRTGNGLGDLTPLAQLRLTEFRAGSWMPATALEVQETLPTGKYDRLGSRLGDGLGTGAYTTTLSINSQAYFWLPTGRILRMRFDLSSGFSGGVRLNDASVYGTASGFRGRAHPGRSLLADASWEVSLTRSWVLALDVLYRHSDGIRVVGRDARDPASAAGSIRLDTRPSGGFGFAPAVEYSWTPNLGVLLGVRVFPPGHNTQRSLTPAIAVNFVR